MENREEVLTVPVYWQVAAGSEQRDYSRYFVNHGLAFVGQEESRQLIRQVRKGDRIVLKLGTKYITAVGVIEERDGRCWGDGDKDWLSDFDGWALPAYCFVKWHEFPKPVEVQGLTRGTLNRIVSSKELQQQVENLLVTTGSSDGYMPEPASATPISDEELLSYLVEFGLSVSNAERLTGTLARIRLLAKYYYKFPNWGEIREHETRTFLIIPLLLALGWTEQQIKIEFSTERRQRIDIACFSHPYLGTAEASHSMNADCVLLLESKGFSQGLDFAPDQVANYAKPFAQCSTLVVSNGYCYKIFEKNEADPRGYSLRAYLNLLHPTDSYPLDPAISGTKEAIRLLLP